MYYTVFSKYKHPVQSLGQATWDRCWKEIKELCCEYWSPKSITWYDFSRARICFSVVYGVSMLQLFCNAGAGIRYIENVCYHHEVESKATWETLNKTEDSEKRSDKKGHYCRSRLKNYPPIELY